MSRICVLVTGVGCCGVGEGIVKALNMAKGKYRIVGTDMHSQSAFSFLVDKGYKIPRATHPNYISTINKICKEEKVDVLIPSSDAEIEILVNNKEKIAKDTFLLCHPKETVNTCCDSWKTYLFLKKHGFNCPESYIPEEPKTIPFPLFIKDRFGAGSRNTFKLEDEEDLKYYLSYFKKHNLKPIIQKFIGSVDEEYTTSVLYSSEGELIDSITFKRTLIAGASGTMIFKDFKNVSECVKQIVSKFKTMGALNVQSRVVDGVVFIFEINPRFSGSTPARVGVGVNEVDLAIDMFYLKKKVEKPHPRMNQVIMRCFQEVYSDVENLEKLEKGEGISLKGKIYDYLRRN